MVRARPDSRNMNAEANLRQRDLYQSAEIGPDYLGLMIVGEGFFGALVSTLGPRPEGNNKKHNFVPIFKTEATTLLFL